MFKTIVLLFTLVLVPLLGGGDHPAALARGEVASYCATGTEMEMLRQINMLRQDNGLPPLSLSKPLGVAAELKASDMATRNYFGHVSPDGQDPRELLDSVGYTPFTSTAENIAAGHADASTTFQQWLNSPDHLHAMLGEAYTAIGIGRAHNPDSEYGWYWVTEFGGEVGTPASACDQAPPPPTATSVPPTATSVPPTATSLPPTATSIPPTATSPPPTATSEPPTITPPPPTATPPLPTATSAVPSDILPTPTSTALNPTVEALIAVLIEILRQILAG